MTIQKMFADLIDTVRAINKKYAEPALKTSPGVNFSLMCLRVYLILLVGLMFFKFYMTLKK
jgi:hypothetical protein